MLEICNNINELALLEEVTTVYENLQFIFLLEGSVKKKL